MRLGIRRKLIGTLMLVGLFPLALSLIVILGGGAAIRLSEIRNSYAAAAQGSSEHISLSLHEELEKLIGISRAPRVIDYVRTHNPGDVGIPALPRPVPLPSAADDALDKEWLTLAPDNPKVAPLLNNEAAERLKILTEVDGQARETFITNAAGQLIAADRMPDDFFQADEEWWQNAFDEGRGKVYISSVLRRPPPPASAPGKIGSRIANIDIIEIAVPLYDTSRGAPVLVGILKDKVAADWVVRSLNEEKSTSALKQLIDLKTHKPVFFTGGDRAAADEAADFYLNEPSQSRVHPLLLLLRRLVLASSVVETMPDLPAEALPGNALTRAKVPEWAVVVSNPSAVAMTPVYRLAMTVAAIGVGLILVLFILGVAISNREIIMPILRLREATAAVGRGELNMRLLSADDAKAGSGGGGEAEGGGEEGTEAGMPAAKDPTFRHDELGELAHDFDQMTRQLQKNVNQLARSNEAKRRFMELAGHELRTPVTYLIGACQLAQRQLQQIAAAATDGLAETPETTTLAAKNAAAITTALGKIAAKTTRLSRIIDNLLKLVNNDQFNTRTIKQPTDMRALVLQVAADQRPFIAERKQNLVVDVPQNLPSIDADRDKLEDALTNLVSNAIRFSPDGGTILVAAHVTMDDNLEILVEDSGPGIPPADLANLFEPFYTGSDIMHHHSGTTEFGSKGIGLGLAIVRRFIELHGGVVRAHAITREGKTGTQFQILLPVAKTEAEGDGVKEVKV